jgi:CTP:molybdopterin cytidylyltransferase MocA
MSVKTTFALMLALASTAAAAETVTEKTGAPILSSRALRAASPRIRGDEHRRRRRIAFRNKNALGDLFLLPYSN